MAKAGDLVRFLNSVGGGRITRIKDNIAYVEDEDGFETPVLIRECVVVGEAPKATTPSQTAVQAKTVQPQPSKAAPTPAPAPVSEEEELPVEETPEGEKLNLVLAYEPRDIKRLSVTTFDTYLVNDSNYYLYFAYMTRSDDSEQWQTQYAGIVEPNIQLFVGELSREELPQMDRVAIQYIAFKRDKGFSLKTPSMIEFKLDQTKFAKLHCFRDNTYFDIPVISYELVKDDMPFKAVVVDQQKLEKAMREKIKADRPRKKIVRKEQKHERRGDIIVVDLHISELVDNIRGLSNADMLNLQIDEFSRVMDENLRNKGQKIVFIHGKGEGVLRKAIMKELGHRYKGHDVQDASFREYGFGATQVTLR